VGVLIVGMHRSGTSAVGAALEAAGLSVGPTSGLVPTNLENPAGFYELQAIADLNDEILAHLGGVLYAPPERRGNWSVDPGLDVYLSRAREILVAAFPAPAFFLKDPRISLLLPFWRRVLLDRCAVVFVVRDPAEVAWSLALRDGIPVLAGLALWAEYNRSALDGMAGLPVHICHYADLVTDPAGGVAEVVASLGDWGELPPGGDLNAAIARVQPELRRNTRPQSELELVDVPGEVSSLYKLLIESRGRHDSFELSGLIEPGWWERPLLEERRSAALRLRTGAEQLAGLHSAYGGFRDLILEMQDQLLEVRERFAKADRRIEALRYSTLEGVRRLEASRADLSQLRVQNVEISMQRDQLLANNEILLDRHQELERKLRDREAALAVLEEERRLFEHQWPVRWFRALGRAVRHP
jgi:hypothetical protein